MKKLATLLKMSIDKVKFSKSIKNGDRACLMSYLKMLIDRDKFGNFIDDEINFDALGDSE